MVAIGSLMFCDDCGNLLEANSSTEKTTLTCEVCHAECEDTSEKVIVTRSKPADFPSELRSRRSDVQGVDKDAAAMQTDIREECEKCGKDEATFFTMQLRSADEGSTVFYTCKTCGHKWNTNN